MFLLHEILTSNRSNRECRLSGLSEYLSFGETRVRVTSSNNYSNVYKNRIQI